MRDNANSVKIIGYLYDISKMSLRTSGPDSKHPGTEYIKGEMNIAVDEKGLNVIPVRFNYMTAFYSKKDKNGNPKPNRTFATIKKMIEEPKTWLKDGKDGAYMVEISGSLDLNDFISSDNKRVSAPCVTGSFLDVIQFIDPDESARNKFVADMVITRVNHVDADPEKNIEKDYTTIGGAVFSYYKELLPMEFKVTNPEGMNLFEDMDISNSEPVYIKVWGHIYNTTIKTSRTEESAFGEAAVTTYERKTRDWVVDGAAKVPYEYGEEDVLTADELIKATQDREIHWATVQKNHDDYIASKNAPKTTDNVVNNIASPTAKVQAGAFKF